MSNDPSSPAMLALPTPKTLREAINQILTMPGNRTRELAPEIMRDFLAQRFGAAVLNHPECEEVLMNLFNRIVSEPYQGGGA